MAGVEMTSRQRVLCAIEHRPADRLARDFDAAPEIVDALIARLGLQNEIELREHFRTDIEIVQAIYNCPHDDGRNIFGIQTMQSSDGRTHAFTHPLAEVRAVDELDEYPYWPDPTWVDLDAMRPAIQRAHQAGKYVVASSWGSIFGETYRLMGMEKLMVALGLMPEVVHAIVTRLVDFFMEVDRRIFTEFAGMVDMSFHGNDMGTQISLMLSPAMFREFFAGPLSRLTGQARSFGLKTMMHSCGAIAKLLPDIINCGYDVIDPVQFTAAGMDLPVLKRDFGSEICFHGAISAQKILPLGTVGDVREHVREVVDIMRPGGGYIFCPDQAITVDTPVENIIAAYQTLDEMGL